MLSRKRIIILTLLVIALSVAGLVYYPKESSKNALAEAELYQLGPETVVLNGVGSTSVGDYKDPYPDGPGVREIVLGYTCIGTEILFGNILPSFAEYWEQKTGEKVRFTAGWNAIGLDSVATAVQGKPVQAAIISTLHNAKSRGYSDTKWQKGKSKGVIFSYPYVFLVRKGNPLNIQTFADLARPEVQVVHLDPLGNHGGMSTVFNLYGAILKESEEKNGVKDHAAAEEFLRQVEEKAVTRFGGKTIGSLFAEGIGDVLITIEPKAPLSIANDPSLEIVVPPNSFSTELSAYKMKKNISNKDEELIDAFIDFLYTEQSQEAYALGGFRPSDPNVLARHPEFPPLPGVFTTNYLGEPTKVKKDVYLGKWLTAYNKSKPEHEKLKLKKLRPDQMPDQSGLPIKEMLPEE